MAAKRRNLFLYLTLACFLGLIAIFVVDGYLGVYDTLYIPSGEREQKIEAGDWSQWAEWGRAEIGWGEKALFRYEVDNRQFSTYSAEVKVSVWHSREKVRDLLSKQIVVDAFKKGELEWVVNTAELLPSGISSEQGYEYTVIIDRGEIERKIILYMYPLVTPPPPR